MKNERIAPGTEPFPAWLHPVLAGLGAAAVVLVLAATSRYGVGLAPDSANYLSAAQSLAAGQGFLRFDGQPYAGWPPLLPLLLAGFRLAGIDPLAGARFLHAFAFGAVVLLAGEMLVRSLRSKPLAVAGALLTLCAYPLQSVSVMLLSDGLFVLLGVLLLFFVGRLVTAGGAGTYVTCCILGALACLERYLGGAFVLAAAGLVLLARREGTGITLSQPSPSRERERKGKRGAGGDTRTLPSPSRGREQKGGGAAGTRALKAAGLLAAGALPVGIWLVRNLALTGTLTGGRTPAAGSVVQNLVMSLTTMSDWFLPRARAQWLGWVLLTAFAAALAVLAVLAWRSRRRRADPDRHVRPAVVFAASYLAALVVAATVFVSDPIADRLMAPVYVPVLLFVLAGLERLGDVAGRRLGRPGAARVAVLVPAGMMLVQPVYWGVRIVPSWVSGGVGEYTRPAWQESPTVAWLRQNPPRTRVLSNDPAAVFLLTGLRAEGSPQVDETPEALEETGRVRMGDYLVWFARSHRPFLRPVEELDRMLVLEPAAVLGDGAVVLVLGWRTAVPRDGH